MVKAGQLPRQLVVSGGSIEVTVDGIAAGGAGVGRLPDGRAVFVHRTLPGDVARVKLTTEKSRWTRGTLLRLDSPGPGRREPTCPLYDRCGGCTLQHMEYAEQLRWKARIVQDALHRIGGCDVVVPETVPSTAQLGYRTRVTFTLRRLRGGRVVAGLHEIHARRRVFDVQGECELPTPQVMDAWSKLRESWGPGAQRLPAGGEVRLVLREVDEGVVLLVSGGSGRCDARALLDSVPELVAVWRVHRRVPARLLAGQSEVHETWMGERVAVPVSSFSQVNKTVGELLHARVLGLASDRPGRVVDAYAGVGLFARTLAAQGRPTVAIELDPETAAAARSGSPEGMTVLEGRVEDLINDVLPTDLMIANPPRAGLHADVAAAVCDRPPGAVIYVSCDPATLARDARRMADRFDLVAVETFDLFPQTAHVETVALFEPRTSA